MTDYQLKYNSVWMKKNRFWELAISVGRLEYQWRLYLRRIPAGIGSHRRAESAIRVQPVGVTADGSERLFYAVVHR